MTRGLQKLNLNMHHTTTCIDVFICFLWFCPSLTFFHVFSFFGPSLSLRRCSQSLFLISQRVSLREPRPLSVSSTRLRLRSLPCSSTQATTACWPAPTPSLGPTSRRTSDTLCAGRVVCGWVAGRVLESW